MLSYAHEYPRLAHNSSGKNPAQETEVYLENHQYKVQLGLNLPEIERYFYKYNGEISLDFNDSTD